MDFFNMLAGQMFSGGNGGGGGVQYTSITYNNDDTITLIDTDGVPHTMVCVYEEDKLSSVTYDGKTIKLTYDKENPINLIKVGRTIVNFDALFSSETEITEELLVDLGDVLFTYDSDMGMYMASVSASDLVLETGKAYNFRIGDTVYKTYYDVEFECGASEGGSEEYVQYGLADGNLMMMVKSSDNITGIHNMTISVLSEEPPKYRFLIHTTDSGKGKLYFASNDFADKNVSLKVTDEDGNVYTHSGQYGGGTVAPAFAFSADYNYYDTDNFFNIISSGKKVTIVATIDNQDGTNYGEKTYELATPDFEYTTTNDILVYGYGYDFVDVFTMQMTMGG